jgi:hypothetical protein
VRPLTIAPTASSPLIYHQPGFSKGDSPTAVFEKLNGWAKIAHFDKTNSAIFAMPGRLCQNSLQDSENPKISSTSRSTSSRAN